MKIKQPGKRLCSLLLACAVLLSGVLGAAAPVLRAQALAPDEIDSFLDALSEQVPMMVFLESNPEGNLTYNCDYANEIVHEALYADFTPRSEVQFVYAKLMANNAATEALGAALYAYGAAAKACFRPELNTVDGDMEVPVPTPGGNTP